MRDRGTGRAMKHSSSRELFAYWDSCRGARRAPDRADIEPGAIRRVLGDSFILAFDPAGGHPFRLAGTRVCALFGGELKGDGFLELWADSARDTASELVGAIAEDTVGAVASVSGHNVDGEELQLELLLLPLTQRGGKMPPRVIGTLAPMQMPYWLGIKPIAELVLGGLRHIGPATDRVAPPRFVSASAERRLPAGFVVHEGGRRG
jgi:hypothetical protein